MPIYEFKCEACGHVFSELRKMGDVDSLHCPNCGSGNARKLMSSFASSSPGKTTPSRGCSHTGGG